MRRLLITLAALTLTGCNSEPEPAVLTDASAETLEVLSGVLAAAAGRASVRLGPVDVTRSPEVTVLPPPLTPLEGNSTAMPIVFDIVLLDGDCYVRERTSGEVFLLADLTCTPV